MKTCIPCGVETIAESPTCANCGEASWSASLPIEFCDTKIEPSDKPTTVDTTPEVSARRRRNR